MNTQATITNAATARLTLDGKDYDLPVLVGSEGERAVDVRKLRDASGAITFDPGVRQHRLVQERHHLHRRRQGDPPLPRLSDRGAREQRLVPRGRLPADLREAAEPATSWSRFSGEITRHTLIHEDMKKFFEGYPVARPSDGDPLVDGGLALDLLPRCHRSRGADVNITRLLAKAPDDRGVLVQEVDRPAVHLPAQRPLVLRQLPAHDVRASRPSRTRCRRPSRRR